MAHEMLYGFHADGNVKYFRGKHTALAVVALLIILIGVPYTVLLFLWQWIVGLSQWKVFKWTKNSKLNVFIATYHAPFNGKYRYWTGLLLMVRVVLYITASVTVSANPQTIPLTMCILVGGLLLIKGSSSIRVYKTALTDILDTVLYFNLLVLAVVSLYDFKTNIVSQRVVADISTVITLILLVGAICYQMFLCVKKKKTSQENKENPPLPHKHSSPTKNVVTQSIVEIPTPQCEPPNSQNKNLDQVEESRM